MSTKVTDEMVSRFLNWKLPDNFSPDAGITFKPLYNEHMPWGGNRHEPMGTNLLDADQARAMLKYVLGDDGLGTQPVGPMMWAPGPSLWKDWCSRWFGPDSDEDYLARAVADLPEALRPDETKGVGVAPPQATEPSAWLVTGGRIFVDMVYLEAGSAKAAVSRRKDGSAAIPLFRAALSPQAAGRTLVCSSEPSASGEITDAVDGGQMARDAARYRWLNGPDSEWEPFDSRWLNKCDLYGQFPADMDAVIDAAMKEQP